MASARAIKPEASYVPYSLPSITTMPQSALLLTFNDVNALMARWISGVGQGMVWMFLYLLALWDDSSESLDAGHVGYPFSFAVVPALSEAIGADVQRCQRPHGGDDVANSNNPCHVRGFAFPIFPTHVVARDVELCHGLVALECFCHSLSAWRAEHVHADV